MGGGGLREGWRGEKLTEGDPFAKVARFLGLDEAGIDVLQQVGDDRVHVPLEGEYMAEGEILGDRTLHAGMLGLVKRAEDVEGLLAIDHGRVVLIVPGLLRRDWLASASV
jgi:hypothetical protein